MSCCNPRHLFLFPDGWRDNGASGACYVMLVSFCRGSNRTVFVSELRTIPHYGLSCDYGNGKFRPALKVIVLVQGKDRSIVQDCAAGKKFPRQSVTHAIRHLLALCTLTLQKPNFWISNLTEIWQQQ